MASYLRTDNASFRFCRQRIVRGLLCRTDSASCRFVSAATARRATRGLSAGHCHRLIAGWQRTGTATESTGFPGILAPGATKATAVGKHPSGRLVPAEACRTDSSPAHRGGSACPSSKRCVVGSRYFFAERSAVGSHLPYFATGSGMSFNVGSTGASGRTRWSPSTTTRSPGRTPERISRRPSCSPPSRTGRRSTFLSSLTT